MGLVAIAVGCLNLYMGSWFNQVASAVAFFAGGIGLGGAYLIPKIFEAYGTVETRLDEIREMTRAKIEQAYRNAAVHIEEAYANIDPAAHAKLIAASLREELDQLTKRGEIPSR